MTTLPEQGTEMSELYSTHLKISIFKKNYRQNVQLHAIAFTTAMHSQPHASTRQSNGLFVFQICLAMRAVWI